MYLSFYEDFGLPPLQATQCGVPVITSDTFLLEEVVGNASIKVAPTNLDALRETMLSVCQNPQLNQRMVNQSLGRAEHFKCRHWAEKNMDAYRTSLYS